MSHARSGRREARPRHRPGPAEPSVHAPAPPQGDLWPLAVAGVLLLVSRVVAAGLLDRGAEDAYITFRYAYNWGHGFGLVYNAGERVWGFSSPLWTGLLALASALNLDLLLAARGLALVADLVSLVVGYRLIAARSVPAARAYAAFFAVWPYFAVLGALGMETSLFWCLLALACAALGRSPWASGLALAGLALVRPEGLFAAGLVGIWASGRARLLGAAVVAAVWVALRLYFGQWLPQSVVAKALTYGASGPWNGRFWYEWLLPFPLGRLPGLMGTRYLTALGIFLAAGTVAGVRALWRERRSPVAALVAPGLGMLLSYAALGVDYFYWYLYVPLASVVVGAAIGLASLRLPALLWAGLLVYAAGSWSDINSEYRSALRTEPQRFGEAADFLTADASARGLSGAARTPSVMLEPIGWIGWSTRMRVVDETGIVTPGVAERRRGGPGWYTDVVRRERPDYLLIRLSMLNGNTAFAGLGQPFRSLAERDTLLADYEGVYPPRGTRLLPSDLVCFRRLPRR
ncbi:MAG TPA: hypothetical protein VMS93_02820 [Candidatus Saccharimonadales bacterium]|nr:hypothetical protein [Candidatus Saccharimonadales bacterium]